MRIAFILLRDETTRIFAERTRDILVAYELIDELVLGPDLRDLAEHEVVARSRARLRHENDALTRREGLSRQGGQGKGEADAGDTYA
jgi:hypothetical protein